MSPNDLTLVAKHVVKLLVERRYDELELIVKVQGDRGAPSVASRGASECYPK